MQTLRVEVDGRALRFPPDRVLRIGRSIDADVVLSAISVSRAHAELRPTPAGWLLVDVGSAGGTFVDGVPVTERPIDGRVVVQCGPTAAGATLSVMPEAAVGPGPAPAPPQPTPPVVPPLPEHTSMRPGHQVPGAPVPPQAYPPAPAPTPGPWAPPQPGGHAPAPVPEGADGMAAYEMTIAPGSAQAPFPGATPQATGPDLLVVAEGREYRFRHPTTVTVGRLPECNVVLDDPACSRQHGRIHPAPGGWVYENLSREGTYAAGRPIQNQPFDESLDLRLGHPVAGPRLSLIPILSAEAEVRRFARRRRNRRLKWLAVAAALVLLVAGAVVSTVLLTRGSGENQLTAAEQHRAMAATVLISYETQTGGSTYYVTGSGSILTKDGLILTNAHVAAPASPGLQQYSNDETLPNPPYVDIHLTSPDDGYRTGAADYRAKVVVADGNRDIAVLQVFADGHGGAVDPSSLSLPTMPLGDSDKVGQGDDVTILGFPAIAQARSQTDPTDAHPEVTVTKGVIATIVDEQRSEFDTDARIASGNSGGAAINDDGALIGVPSSAVTIQGSPGESGRIRPLAYVRDLIAQAEKMTRS